MNGSIFFRLFATNPHPVISRCHLLPNAHAPQLEGSAKTHPLAPRLSFIPPALGLPRHH